MTGNETASTNSSRPGARLANGKSVLFFMAMLAWLLFLGPGVTPGLAAQDPSMAGMAGMDEPAEKHPGVAPAPKQSHQEPAEAHGAAKEAHQEPAEVHGAAVEKHAQESPAVLESHQEPAAGGHGGSPEKHDEAGAAARQPHQEPVAEGHGGSGEKHVEAEAGAGGHGHGGAPGVGYIGLNKREGGIDEAALKGFKERLSEEAMSKGRLDQARLVFFALSFLAVCLAFARNEKLGPITRGLRAAVDWHALGTVTGIILAGLVIPSGIIVTFFFMPTSTGVYPSVEAMSTSPGLAFFRNLHNWSSEVFIWLLLLHAARTISTHTFLGKRKFIWLAGAIASAVGWVAFLSGSFMRGDQEALEGFEHMMYSFTLVPGGGAIARFFSGELTLIRLTTLHVIATIFIMAVFLGLHVLMRKVHVLVESRWKTATIYSCVLTLLLAVQSIYMEAPFVRGLAGIPTISGIEYTKPPWPIYFLIQGENWFGANAMVMILAITFVPLIILPYVVELLPLPDQRKRLVGEGAFYVGVFGLLLVSFIAAGGKIIAHIFM